MPSGDGEARGSAPTLNFWTKPRRPATEPRPSVPLSIPAQIRQEFRAPCVSGVSSHNPGDGRNRKRKTPR